VGRNFFRQPPPIWWQPLSGLGDQQRALMLGTLRFAPTYLAVAAIALGADLSAMGVCLSLIAAEAAP